MKKDISVMLEFDVKEKQLHIVIDNETLIINEFVEGGGSFFRWLRPPEEIAIIKKMVRNL